METLVSIIIPIAPYHTAIASRAVASAHNQTVPSTVMVAKDRDGKGAGFTRNRALELVKTRFVVFLDADDWIAPTFVERCLQAWQPGHYVYTDWQEGDKVKVAPDKPFLDGSWHVITTLIPTVYALRAGGFDETMSGGEDTAFFMALMAAGYCGVKVGEPLFYYGSEGLRGKTFFNSPERDTTMARVKKQFGEKAMACCGGAPVENKPNNDPQDGDILCIATWMGNRRVLGTASGRLYPRTGNGAQVWVNAGDVRAMPHMFREIPKAPELPPLPPQEKREIGEWDVIVPETAANGINEVAAQLWRVPVPPAPVTADELKAVKPAVVKPNARKVSKLAEKHV